MEDYRTVTEKAEQASRLILWIIAIAIGVGFGYWMKGKFDEHFSSPECEAVEPLVTEDDQGTEALFIVEDLLNAIRWQESKDGKYLYGDYRELPADWEPKESYPLRQYGAGVAPIYAVWDAEANTAIYYEAQAVGPYHICKLYVDDVNRFGVGHDMTTTYGGTIVFTPRPDYKYSDRLGPIKSREMVRIFLDTYVGIAEWNGVERPTQMERFEAMARIHNGGPDGYKKESTKAYWAKIKARMLSR